MPTNSESLNRELFRLLSKYKPKPLDAEGKVTPVPEEADVFKFEFTKDGEDYGTVYVTIDDERVLTLYYGDDVSDSPGDKTPGLGYDDTWWGLHDQLSAWRMTKGLRGFKTQNKDRVGDDMARRNHMRNKDKIAEGYYPMGRKASYSDAIPTVKIVIEHSRVIEEGEQRYRNINKIFLENQEGERYLLDTKKPGIARVYARHIAEGGKVNDDRWNHVHSLCEEYSKMAGFVRATRNGQFNESAQSLVNEGIAHYASLRESLSRMTGKRGYNAYFESWTPALMEDGTEENNLNELFVQETLDPRIESVMPILNRIHKKVSESVVDKEMSKLAEWADSLTEAEGESIQSNNPVGIPEEEELAEAEMDESALQAYLGNKKYGEKGMDALRKAGREHAGKEKMQSIRAKFSKKEEVDEDSFDPLKHIDKKNQNPAIKQAAKDVKRGSYADRAALMKAGGVKDDRGPAGVTSMDEGSHEEEVSRLAAYNERMAGENPPIDLGLREVGNWAKVGHYGDPIKTAWLNIAKYGLRNNRFNNSVEEVMSAIGEFPDLEDEVYDMYDINQDEVDALYHAYETVYDQYDQLQGATNENFINQADQAVTSEGEHTQHAMRGRNPGANEFEHDFEPEDKIGNIHDKISKMLKKLEKPKHEPSMKDTDLGNTLHEVDTGEYDARKSTHKGETTPEQEKEFRKKVDTYGDELEQRQKEKGNVKEGQEDFDAILRIISKKNVKESIQLNEGLMDSLNGMIAKIKAMPGIQKYIQMAQSKKAELTQALQHSANGKDLVANIQQAVGGQQAVAEGWGQKIGGAVAASAGGGLLAGAADIMMRAYIAMGKPDLTQMMNDPNGKNALVLVSMLVVLGALAMFAGGHQVKQGMDDDIGQQLHEGQEDLDAILRIIRK
jgi:hypothetical protein